MKQQQWIERVIDLAIDEDIASGDISTQAIVPQQARARAIMTAKADGVISGLDLIRRVFERFEESITWSPFVGDGDKVKSGDKIVLIEAHYSTLLQAERTALNFLQRMSGIATTTALFVSEIAEFHTTLLDTRKTVPGLRLLDKMAVRHGGGSNHRMGLYDMVMLKDNHIKLAGGIKKAVEQVKAQSNLSIKIEVETTNLGEVQEALEAGVDIIMLDNMSPEQMEQAVKILDSKVKTEASGNMSLSRLKQVAATGVDYISVGALTHSVTALDISMNIVPCEKE